MGELRDFMFARVYLGPAVRAEHEKISSVVRRLFDHYVEHPEQLPPAIGAQGDGTEESGRAGEGDLARRVTDYLAGMTDRYCIRRYTELQVPQAFAR
jgi:dGTPase